MTSAQEPVAVPAADLGREPAKPGPKKLAALPETAGRLVWACHVDGLSGEAAAPLLDTSSETLAVCVLSDAELGDLAREEEQQGAAIRKELEELKARWWFHESRRRQAAREMLRRTFVASPFGRLLADMVLPFLGAVDALRWFSASPAAAAQLCGGQGCARVHHIHRVASKISMPEAFAVVPRLHWPSVQTMVVDFASLGWSSLLSALCEAPSQRLSSLSGLAVAFPAERSSASLQQWQSVAPTLTRLGPLLSTAPLQELVLTDLRSADVLKVALRCCHRHIRVVRASFIGPECRRSPLELPSEGLPVLECMMVKHRDFCEQRASRRDRMSLAAASLLPCLQSIREPAKLRVLAFSGICIDGSREETATLLRGLRAYTGLVAVALRFSVPSTFGTLLPLHVLIGLRCTWPLIGHFAVGNMSLHGFDYWPEQMTEFQQLYPRGKISDPYEVFSNEFRSVLSTQYGTTAESQWARLDKETQAFWSAVARRLPAMPHSEVRRRVADLFPTVL